MADFRLGRLKFNWRGAWAASTAYVIDDIVSFKGNTYVCVVNHTSASSEGAWASTDLNIGTPRWELHVPGIRILGTWQPNTFYAENDLVSYGANQYLCVGNHTSSASETVFYTISDSPYWSLYAQSTRYVGDWSGGVWYKLNDITKYGNNLYIVTAPHTSGINFDPTKFNVYLEAIKFEDSYDANTQYQPGDIVTFGGYTYIAKTISTGKQPNIYAVDSVDGNGDPVPADWDILTTGFDVKGEYDNTVVYVPGDVVQFGGNSYVKIATGAAGVYPIDTNAWSKVSSGLNWRGPWDSTATYQVNDVVSKQSASWVCLTPHNINIDPVADGGTNWQAVAQGESTLTLQNPGDILYRNNAGANVNLPIGTEGQILTVDAQGLPAWERNNLCANVFYVATDGTDDPDYGKNISKPWRTVRYALSQLPAGSATNINTIFVKSGTYQEQLPLTVPEYTSIVGDNLRATVIAPDPNTSSTDPTPVENRFSTMFILSESTTLKDMIFSGMEGFEPAAGVDDYDITQATVRGVFLRLNPNTPILGKSPYITQCSAFSGRPIGTATNCTGGVGAIIDKAIYGQTTSNGSMLFDSFTQFHDLGVGFWCKDLGNAEIVSSFTYYCQIGYTCTGGGRIRSLVGNNSWGTYGAVSIGYDVNETPVTGNVRGQRLNFLYDENSALFVQDEEVVQGADDGVVDQSWAASAGTTVALAANATYSGVASTSNGAGTGATFDVARDANGDVSTITAVTFGSGYTINEVLTIDGSLIGGATTTDDVTLTLSAVADDFSVSNGNYARALVLYVQSEYLIIEAITGTFTEDKPVKGDGSANIVASGATARTAAGGATPALEGVKGKIFPLTNLPVDGSNNPIFPRPTGATQFLNVQGNNAYDDSGSYVIKEVVDPSSASNLFISALRRYDVPGAAPDELTIVALSRTNEVATVTTSTPHGLSTGDQVTIVIANTSNDIEGFATGYDSTDDLVLGIRSGVLQRTVITEVAGNGSQFTYPNLGSNIEISAAQGNNGLITGSLVYKQGTSGGNTKLLHLGGSAVDLYNVSTSTTRLSPSGVAGIDSSTGNIAFADSGLSLLDTYGGSIAAGANNYLMINNELMRITATNDQGCVVARGKEGTTAAAHAEGSIIYYVQKNVASTTLRSDVDTAVTDIPLFSISNFDTHDMARIGAVLDPQTGETSGGEYFKITSVNSPNIGRATIIFAQPKNINANSGQAVEIRLRYSQVRMTGHDFLQVGTGSKYNTNWPDQPFTDPDQAKETKEDLPGRVYYVSSDQDGNFRVGEFFTVEQATGTATLDASAFNLAGLASLRLGTLGAELGVAINEFSSDKTLGGDFARDSAVPTQLAVKTYVDNSVGAGVNRTAPLIGVQSLTSSGTTATVSAYVAPNVYVGDYVFISGADQANYNGLYQVNAIDEANNSFTYVMNGTAVSPATGAITVERKQRIASDLEVEGRLEINPTWNALSDLDALKISATDTQSTSSTTLIKASVSGGNSPGDKFVVDKNGNLTIAGNLIVSGTTTTINSTTLTVDDKQVVIGDGLANDATGLSAADGAGLVVGNTGRSIKYNNGQTRWDFENCAINAGSNSGYYIGGTSVLSSTTLGANITGSSLTSVGTLGSLSVTGQSRIASVNEAMSITSGGSSTQTIDFSTQAISYFNTPTGNLILSLTSVPTDTSKAMAFTAIVYQGATPYGVSLGTNEFGINSTTYTVKWAGDGTAPTPSASKLEFWSFTILCDASGTFTVYGQKSEFAQ